MDALKSIKSTAKLVLEILEENEFARKNDFRLYVEVLRKKGINLDCPAHYFFYTAKYLKVPSFETVTRCRRHIQKKHPDLVDEQTAEARAEFEEEIKEFVKQPLEIEQ